MFVSFSEAQAAQHTAYRVAQAVKGRHHMETKRKQSFLLRLPVSIRERAMQLAHEEGTSLNHFIALAMAEKISRMEQQQQSVLAPQQFRPQAYSFPRHH